MEATFNDTKCYVGRVCQNDPLLFTCNITGSTADEAVVVLPPGQKVVLGRGNNVEGNLPDGVHIHFHGVTISERGTNYILSLTIQRASLLNGSVILCDAGSSPLSSFKIAGCLLATGIKNVRRVSR